MKTEQLLYRLYKGQLCIKTLLMNVFIYTYYLNKHFLNIRKAVWYQEKILNIQRNLLRAYKR